MIRRIPRGPAALLLLAAAGCASTAPGADAGPAASPDAPIVQPGAPGEATRTFDPAGLGELGGVAWTEADVAFMQGMILHHAQATEMTELVEDRTESDAIRQIALRIDISQRDEIALMERWLRERGQTVPGEAGDDSAGHAGHAGHAAHGAPGPAGPMMPGMLTPAQMAELEAARGEAFDRLFLQGMIQHHQGAIVMVRDLFSSPGAGQESEIFQFASHVEADQIAEIRRMQGLLER